MRQNWISLVAAVLVAVPGAVVAASAAAAHTGAVSALERGEPAAGSGQAKVAWTQKIVPVGTRDPFDLWRCSVTANGVVYVATGATETATRAELAPYTAYYARCRREERKFPFFF